MKELSRISGRRVAADDFGTLRAVTRLTNGKLSWQPVHCLMKNSSDPAVWTACSADSGFGTGRQIVARQSASQRRSICAKQIILRLAH
jgi:hypothetical protein